MHRVDEMLCVFLLSGTSATLGYIRKEAQGLRHKGHRTTRRHQGIERARVPLRCASCMLVYPLSVEAHPCCDRTASVDTGGDVSLHEFPSFDLLSSFSSHTKGAASLFSTSTLVHHPAHKLNQTARTPDTKTSSLPPEVHTTLAIAARRRLVLLTWIDGSYETPAELALPHQIRGMAFDERALVAGFSTGEYGVVSLPVPGSTAAPTMGELFSVALPTAIDQKSRAGSVTLGGFGLGALGLGSRKIDKNDVLSVPRMQKGKQKDETGSSNTDWLWSVDSGWPEPGSDAAGEVFVVRESRFQYVLRLTSLN